jgi:nucleotide-binding universal stress UspA family protein
METVLVGFEDTDSAARALRRAADLAEALHARLVVVSVTEPTLVPVAEPVLEPVGPLLAPPIGPAPPVPEIETGSRRPPNPEEVSRLQLERARAYLVQRGVDAEYVAEVGEPAEQLLEAAERFAADLIVVGHREHGFLERLLRRPVDEAVARRADRDVLLVH